MGGTRTFLWNIFSVCCVYLAIAGKDHRFYWADAEIVGDKVAVSSPNVEKPIAVRYAWSTNPECNLYNKEHLPASPFRTESW